MRPIDADELKAELKSLKTTICGITSTYNITVDEFKKSVLRTIDEQPTVNEWTMCFEKLPSVSEKVIACDAEGNIEEGFVEKVGKHVICKTGDHFCLDYVVAWMSLPKPYEGEVKE